MAINSIAANDHPTTTQRPRPGRRRQSRLIEPFNTTICTLALIFVILSFVSSTEAADVDHDSIARRSPEFRRLAQRGAILTHEVVGFERKAVLEREEIDTTSERPISSEEGSTSTSSLAARSDDAGSPTIITASNTAQTSPLPSPFDFSLGVNYTSQSCPGFIRDIVANSTLKSCLPASLLLQSSNSFFQASRSPLMLSLTLDTACGVDSVNCGNAMTDLAKQLIDDENCGQDYRNQQPYVVQAHSGLVAYEPIYQATCVKNNDTGNYCFADAITNATNPSDSYPYYIALGIQLPGGSRPTCNRCLQDAMAVYAQAAGSKEQPVTNTYLTAAQLINVNCGPNFVNATLPTGAWGRSVGERASTSATWVLAFTLLVGFAIAT